MARQTSHWTTLSILSLALISADASAKNYYHPAQQPCPCILSAPATGVYFGVFGGGGGLNSPDTSQRGTAFYSEASSVGGPLAVDAEGHVDSDSIWFAGAHLGYAWKNVGCITPAIEVEGFYLSNNLDGTLDAPHTALPEHTFDDSFPLRSKVFLINTVYSLNNAFACSQLRPYIGLGLGGAILSVSGAHSTQISPAEAGVNHFNTEAGATDNVFAGQVKAGLSYAITDNISVFAEYRFLYLGSSKFLFGSTVYPALGHVPTSPWNVNVDGMNYNLGSVGIELSV